MPICLESIQELLLGGFMNSPNAVTQLHWQILKKKKKKNGLTNDQVPHKHFGR